MEALEIFEEYKPIKAIYENDSEYICIPETPEGGEPITVFYNKLLGKYDRLFWYEYSPVDDIETSELIYGEPLDFSDK